MSARLDFPIPILALKVALLFCLLGEICFKMHQCNQNKGSVYFIQKIVKYLDTFISKCFFLLFAYIKLFFLLYWFYTFFWADTLYLWMTSQIACYKIISPSYAWLNSAVVCTCIVHIPDIPLISIVTIFIKSFYNFISTANFNCLF